MLPLLPPSPYIRSKRFVAEEWNSYFAPNATKPANTVDAGWRGVLYANLAIIDPQSSWRFFADPNFNLEYIDGGATRAWYLAFAAGEFLAPYLHRIHWMRWLTFFFFFFKDSAVHD